MNTKSGFVHKLFVVALAHAGIVLTLAATSLLHSCQHSQPLADIPSELVVEIPIDADLSARNLGPVEEHTSEIVSPETAILPPPDSVPTKPKELKKPAPPKPKPAPDRKVRRVVPGTPVKPIRKSNLTAEEIQKLLDKGGKPSSHVSLSDDQLKKLANSDVTFGKNGPAMTEDQMYLAFVQQTMYNAWAQPGALSRGLRTTMEISLASNGAITGSRMIQSSGNATMDDSVAKAVAAVPRIQGLTPEFISSHRTISVAFELTDQQ